MHSIEFFTISLLLISALPAQDAVASDWRGLPLRRAEILDPEQHGFRASRSAGKVVELVIGAGSRLPLQRPVSDWQIAELPGQVYVILAGGIRESLDLYLYEGKTGSVEVIGTDGGRLLPAEFGEDQGSWPLFEGRALVFFPYERDDKLHFTVVNFQGQVLARRILPLAVDAYRVEIDSRSYQVRVSFDMLGEALTFMHPAAPRLVLDAGTLRFSGPERRSVLLRNQGRRPLHVELTLEGQGYRIVGPHSAVIPASSTREITVEMSRLADDRASLVISSAVPGAQAVVGLYHSNALATASDSVPVVAEPEAPPIADAQTVSDGVVTDASDVPSAEPPFADHTSEVMPLPILGAEECAGFELRRLDGDRVEVSGRPLLASGHADVPDLLVRNHRSGEVCQGVLGKDGSFRITIAASDGDDLECGYANPEGEVSYRALAPILPALSYENGALFAQGRAGTEIMLLEVITRGAMDLPSRVLRCWRLVTDGRGRVRIPFSSLGVRKGPASFMLLSPRSGGQVSQTQVITVPSGVRRNY